MGGGEKDGPGTGQPRPTDGTISGTSPRSPRRRPSAPASPGRGREAIRGIPEFSLGDPLERPGTRTARPENGQACGGECGGLYEFRTGLPVGCGRILVYSLLLFLNLRLESAFPSQIETPPLRLSLKKRIPSEHHARYPPLTSGLASTRISSAGNRSACDPYHRKWNDPRCVNLYTTPGSKTRCCVNRYTTHVNSTYPLSTDRLSNIPAGTQEPVSNSGWGLVKIDRNPASHKEREMLGRVAGGD